jgi:hypothetical protein
MSRRSRRRTVELPALLSRLEIVRMIDTPEATHTRYRVRRRAGTSGLVAEVGRVLTDESVHEDADATLGSQRAGRQPGWWRHAWVAPWARAQVSRAKQEGQPISAGPLCILAGAGFEPANIWVMSLPPLNPTIHTESRIRHGPSAALWPACLVVSPVTEVRALSGAQIREHLARPQRATVGSPVESRATAAASMTERAGLA